MQSHEILQLYRQILRYARHYPSKKRDAIILDIKQAFHENKFLEDSKRLQDAIQQAKIGLSELRQWVPDNLQGSDGSWSVSLRGNTIPMDQSTDVIKMQK